MVVFLHRIVNNILQKSFIYVFLIDNKLVMMYNKDTQKLCIINKKQTKETIMKKLLMLLLALTMMLTFVACSEEEAPAPAEEPAATEEPAAEEPAEEPAAEEPAAEEPATDAAEEEPAAEEAGEEEYFSQDLTITNSTGFEIYELYITPSTQEDFGPDLLGEDIFAVDGVLEFTTDSVGTADATWDIRAVDGEGNAVDFMGANFSTSTTLDINMGEDGATPTITMG